MRPVTELLSRNGLQPGDLAAIELLGGGSRIPRVKAELSAALGGRALDVYVGAQGSARLGEWVGRDACAGVVGETPISVHTSPYRLTGESPALHATRRHLDADEAVVLGAALVAANRSTQYRVRPFGLVDKVPYSVSYALSDGDDGG